MICKFQAVVACIEPVYLRVHTRIAVPARTVLGTVGLRTAKKGETEVILA
jgi:hypothetical protein